MAADSSAVCQNLPPKFTSTSSHASNSFTMDMCPSLATHDSDVSLNPPVKFTLRSSRASSRKLIGLLQVRVQPPLLSSRTRIRSLYNGQLEIDTYHLN